MLIRLLALFVLLPACGAATGPYVATQGQPTHFATPTEKKAPAAGKFDGLTITLVLKASSVPSGGTVGSTLMVRNDSGETIIDPACRIGSGRYALVPVDDPDAELWLQPVADCPDAFKMPDGFDERYVGPSFPATTKTGEALAPGQYIATLEIDGYSERLEESIEVTE